MMIISMGQEIGKAPMLYSLKSPDKTLLEVSGGGENEEEEETSVRKVGKGVRKESGNSRETVKKRKGVDVFGGDLVERSA